MGDVIHIGKFDKNISRHKGAVEENMERGRQFMVTQSEKLIDVINNGLDSIRIYVSPKVLTRQPLEILYIEGGWKESNQTTCQHCKSI